MQILGQKGSFPAKKGDKWCEKLKRSLVLHMNVAIAVATWLDYEISIIF